jgi:hypothetical protein
MVAQALEASKALITLGFSENEEFEVKKMAFGVLRCAFSSYVCAPFLGINKSFAT